MTLVLSVIGAMAAIVILFLAGVAVICAIRGWQVPPMERLICVLAVIGAVTPPYSPWGTGGMILLAAIMGFLVWADAEQHPPKGI